MPHLQLKGKYNFHLPIVMHMDIYLFAHTQAQHTHPQASQLTSADLEKPSKDRRI